MVMNRVLATVAIVGVTVAAGLTDFDRAYVATPMPVEAGPADPAGPPELPKALVDTSDPAITGRTIHVPAGGNLQGAIDEAKPGDRITLQPGATYEGPFRLRPKAGDGWIVIATASRDLPKPGTRVTPAHARLMPKITGSAEALIETDGGAHHYRLMFLEFQANQQGLSDIVRLGDLKLDFLPADEEGGS